MGQFEEVMGQELVIAVAFGDFDKKLGFGTAVSFSLSSARL